VLLTQKASLQRTETLSVPVPQQWLRPLLAHPRLLRPPRLHPCRQWSRS